jgi:hypothetical protein
MVIVLEGVYFPMGTHVAQSLPTMWLRSGLESVVCVVSRQSLPVKELDLIRRRVRFEADLHSNG